MKDFHRVVNILRSICQRNIENNQRGGTYKKYNNVSEPASNLSCNKHPYKYSFCIIFFAGFENYFNFFLSEQSSRFVNLEDAQFNINFFFIKKVLSGHF